MLRVPEPELMDDLAQAQAYASADFAEVNQGFTSTFLEHFPAFRSGRLLDLGCGPADIPIRLCQALPKLHITAVDGAANMLKLGQDAAQAAGVQDRLQLVHAYLPAPLPGPFDALISNSLLHHLPDPHVLWDSVARHSAPGAPILVMDLRRPPDAEAAKALVQQYADGEPDLLRRDFLLSLHAAFTVPEIEAQLARAGLSHLQVSTPSDRHVLVSGKR